MPDTEPAGEIRHEWYITCEVRDNLFQFTPHCSCGWKGRAQRQHLKGREKPTLESKKIAETAAGEAAYGHSRSARGLSVS